jgi:4-hydroxy-tetrahydrodipicolinate reductase
MGAPTRVGVLGAGGRMGAETCRAVDADAELELVARIGRGDARERLVEAGARVAVDFTTPAAVKDNVRFCLENRIHVVVGTTGLSAEDLEEVAAWTFSAGANAIVAPNFAVGAVLMMRFAAEAAPFFDAAEIVERHHAGKRDAPSGTALRTAAVMNDSRGGEWASLQASQHSRGEDVGGVRLHSLRLPGSVAHQEVVLGSPGETLVIRHDSLDRSSFMPGVVRAVKAIATRRGLTVGLDQLLFP